MASILKATIAVQVSAFRMWHVAPQGHKITKVVESPYEFAVPKDKSLGKEPFDGLSEDLDAVDSYLADDQPDNNMSDLEFAQ